MLCVCVCGKKLVYVCVVHMGPQSPAFFSDTLSVGVHGHILYISSLLPHDFAATPTLTGGGS